MRILLEYLANNLITAPVPIGPLVQSFEMDKKQE